MTPFAPDLRARLTPGPGIAVRRFTDLQLYSAAFAGAAASFCIARLAGHGLGLLFPFFAIAGSATCGWSWLVARALFRPPADRGQRWPLAIVLGVIGLNAFLLFSGDRTTPLTRMAGSTAALVGSALLMMAMVEPLRNMERGMARSELQFRAVFASGYGLLLLIAVIGIDGMSPGGAAPSWSGPVKAACTVLGLIGAWLAVRYRRAHPLPCRQREQRRAPAAGDDGLGERLAAMIGDEAIYALSDLRVADVARRLGEPDYKVTRCITGSLGFRNFNHMVNHARIEAAKRRFADAAFDHLPVLTIALDCGFGSIGPFNRAFKLETGMTPVDFRRAARAGRTAARP